jgi:hypothetical protein
MLSSAKYKISSLGTQNTLKTNENLYSPDDKYRTVIQNDCNLVTYKDGVAIWNSQTQGKGSGCYARINNDGNFVVYDSQNNVIWQTKTVNSGVDDSPYNVVLENTGNLVIYSRSNKCIWASNGCSTAKSVPRVLKKLTPVAKKAVAKQTKKLIKKFKKPLFKPINKAKGKPKIRSYPPKQKKLTKKLKDLIKAGPKRANLNKFSFMKKLKGLVDSGNAEDKTGWVKFKKILRKHHFKSKKALHKIKNQIQEGASFVEIQQKMKLLAKRKLKKMIKKSKRPDKKSVKPSPKKVLKNLKHLKHIAKIREVIDKGKIGKRGFKKIKKILIKHHITGPKSWFKKIKKAVKTKNFHKVFKAITTSPVPKKIVPVRRTPIRRQVRQKRWVLRQRYFQTWHWAWQLRFVLQRRWFLWWRWFVWVLRWVPYQRWYWASYNYWSYE